VKFDTDEHSVFPPRSAGFQPRLLMLVALAVPGLTLAASSGGWAGSTGSIQSTSSAITTIQRIATLYADDAVQRGVAVGVEIGVVAGDNPPQFVSAGQAVAGPGEGRPFSPDLIFQIGSVSKVFSTNLLGQAVYSGSLSLDDQLSSFAAETGPLPTLVGEVTLGELGDFTGGFPEYAPPCDSHRTPGCLRSSRPSIQEYTAQDFLRFFRHTTPMNFFNSPPTPVTRLPALYNYSDFSVGLLGLVLGGDGAPLTNQALTAWTRKLQSELLDPLSMTSTFLFGVPADQAVHGYDRATAEATVEHHHISSIKVLTSGSLYSSPPTVTIAGGGGVGASAVAELDKKSSSIKRIEVTNGGSGYVAPAKITFKSKKDGPTKIAKATVVVQNGSVVAIQILTGGKGYKKTPAVTIKGGRAADGSDATALAHMLMGKWSMSASSKEGRVI
jgi:CubicO group peptidase (beta-lactamase class C family)